MSMPIFKDLQPRSQMRPVESQRTLGAIQMPKSQTLPYAFRMVDFLQFLYFQIIQQMQVEDLENGNCDSQEQLKGELWSDEQKNVRNINLAKFFQSLPVQIFGIVFTIYSLIGEDLRILAFDKSADSVFNILNIVTMGVFTSEIIFSIIIYKKYLWTFFFWLDLFSDFSLVMDFLWVRQAMFSSNTNLLVISGGTRTARICTRAIRIFRVIKLLKLYKSPSEKIQKENEVSLKKALHKKNKRQKSKNVFDSNENTGLYRIQAIHLNQEMGISQHKSVSSSQEIISEKKKQDSRVNKLLTQKTIKKVIIIILLLTFFIPLMDYQIFESRVSLANRMSQQLQQLMQNQPLQITEQYIAYIIQQYKYNEGLQLFKLEIRGTNLSSYITDQSLVRIEDKRQVNKQIGNFDQYGWKNVQIEIVLSRHNFSKLEASLSLGLTIFIAIILAISLHFLEKTINQLVIKPIQRMIKKVQQIAKNPSKANKLQLLEQQKGTYETIIIENSIIKICSLLSLVFGTAGAGIIGANLTSFGDVNAIIKGKKKLAIFGFCDIRNFTDATQALQEEVMIFVNRIAQIVHTAVDRYSGSANKNIGDAFLLVWPVPQQKYNLKPFFIKQPEWVQILCDFSLLSFIKIIAKLNKQPQILQYRNNQSLCKRIGPGYKVKMGFGLHLGWGIQGPIGSEFKIDASYLSPNVNMASRLEAATKQYGVPILFSNVIQQYMSEKMKKFTRKIDRVTVKGSTKPIELYTVDLHIENLSMGEDKQEKYLGMEDNILNNEQKKEIMSEYFQNEEFYDVGYLIQEKKEFRQLLLPIDEQFNQMFKQAIEYYEAGEWKTAGQMQKLLISLVKCLQMKEDPPSKTLYNFLNPYFVAPSNWQGYRQLIQK